MRRTFASMAPDLRFSGRHPLASVREAQEIAELIKLVLVNANTEMCDSACDAIMLETLTGGRSGSFVFKATPLSTDGRRLYPARTVIKVAPLDAGTTERGNYQQFVRPFLPSHYRPELHGFATAHDRAALCYSLLGDGDKPETLTDRLAMGGMVALDPILLPLFEHLHHWYSASQTRPEKDLAQYYLTRYFKDTGSAILAESTLFRHAAQYFGAQHNARGYRIHKVDFPAICETLFGRCDAPAYTSCIVHGDLNSDNVMLDRHRQFAGIIDFQRTGRGHIFQDIVALEMSVRINAPSNATFDDIWEVERLIALGKPHIGSNPYAAAIIGIRQAGRRLFGFDEAFASYQFAVAATGLRLMRATDLSDAACARITASVLWAATKLTED